MTDRPGYRRWPNDDGEDWYLPEAEADNAQWLHQRAIWESVMREAPGFYSDDMMARTTPNPSAAIATLVRAGVWRRIANGWVIEDSWAVKLSIEMIGKVREENLQKCLDAGGHRADRRQGFMTADGPRFPCHDCCTLVSASDPIRKP